MRTPRLSYSLDLHLSVQSHELEEVVDIVIMSRSMGVRSCFRAPLGALALLAVVLLVSHAFVLPAVSRPIREGRELLSESVDAEDTVTQEVSCNVCIASMLMRDLQ